MVRKENLKIVKYSKSQKFVSAVAQPNQPQRTVLEMSKISANNTVEIKVREGEIKMAAFAVEHSLPFTVSHHLLQFKKSVCGDSDMRSIFPALGLSNS